MTTSEPWEKVDAAEVPAGLRWDVRREDQGQMIERAYGTFGRAEAGPLDGWKRVRDLTVVPPQAWFYRRAGGAA